MNKIPKIPRELEMKKEMKKRIKKGMSEMFKIKTGVVLILLLVFVCAAAICGNRCQRRSHVHKKWKLVIMGFLTLKAVLAFPAVFFIPCLY